MRWLVFVVAACGSSTKHAPDATPRCDPSTPFHAAAPIAGIDTGMDEFAARLSSDELSIVFARKTANGLDLYVAQRASASDAFGAAQVMGTVNSLSADAWPSLSPDSELLAFDSDRSGAFHIYTSTRTSATGAFGPPAVALALEDGEQEPYVANARALYFASAVRMGAGMSDLWRADFDRTGAMNTPAPVAGGVNGPDDESAPVVTPDELEIYFRHASATATPAIFTATRGSPMDGFTAPAAVGELDMAGADVAPTWISSDGCRLYLQTNAPGGAGGYDLYVANR